MNRVLGSALLVSSLAVVAPLGLVDPTWAGNGTDEKTGWLGVSVRDHEPDDEKQLDLDPGIEGVVVTHVGDDSPAGRAGIESGDLITQVDGRSVRRAGDLVRLIRDRKAGDVVRLTVVHDGRTDSREIELADRPDRNFVIDRRDLQPSRHVWRSRPQLGVVVTELDPDLAHYFDVGKENGLLVTKVVEDSGAERAGVKSGDVIQEVAGTKVRSPDELHRVLEEHGDGETVEVVVKRRKKKKTFEIVLEQSPVQTRSWRSIVAPDFSGGDDVRDLRRRLRDLRRELQELQREMRTLRRK